MKNLNNKYFIFLEIEDIFPNSLEIQEIGEPLSYTYEQAISAIKKSIMDLGFKINKFSMVKSKFNNKNQTLAKKGLEDAN